MAGLGACNGFGRYAKGSWLPMARCGKFYMDPEGITIVAPDEFREATQVEIAAEMTSRGEVRIGFPPATP